MPEAMPEEPIDVERIVREVLAQLEATPQGASAPDLPDVPDLPESSDSPPRRADNELVVHSRVVTLSDVEGRLHGIRRLLVPPRAVVTPAVRDELRRRNVALDHTSVEASQMVSEAASQVAKPVSLVLLAVGGRAETSATAVALASSLASALADEGIEVRQDQLDCLMAATERLAAELSQGVALGLLLTRHTAAGLCLANRHRGVRAVSGTDAATVSAAADCVGANLLVLDPAAVNLFQLKRMVALFCRGGVRRCPEAFREKLI